MNETGLDTCRQKKIKTNDFYFNKIKLAPALTFHATFNICMYKGEFHVLIMFKSFLPTEPRGQSKCRHCGHANGSRALTCNKKKGGCGAQLKEPKKYVGESAAAGQGSRSSDSVVRIENEALESEIAVLRREISQLQEKATAQPMPFTQPSPPSLFPELDSEGDPDFDFSALLSDDVVRQRIDSMDFADGSSVWTELGSLISRLGALNSDKIRGVLSIMNAITSEPLNDQDMGYLLDTIKSKVADALGTIKDRDVELTAAPADELSV